MNSFLDGELFLVFAPLAQDGVHQGEPAFFLRGSDWIELFEEPSWFLHKKFVSNGSSPSRHTWAAGAYDLKTWFNYLNAIKVDWRDATESHRAAFSDDYSQAVSPRTGREFGDATINRILSTTREFYSLAKDQGWYVGDIGSYLVYKETHDVPIDNDALAHTRVQGRILKQKDPLLKKVGRKDVIRPLQVKELRKLIEFAGPSAANRQGDMRRVRDRLILDFGWVCGMRLGDVLNLTTLKFESIVVEPGHEVHSFPLIVEKGKGKTTRLVSVPGWLVRDVQEYIFTEREESLRLGRARGVKRTHSLFLGHSNGKSAGRPISRKGIQDMFEAACIACGIVEKVEKINAETGERFVKVIAKHSYHDTRHNCAVLTYHAERALGNHEPWKVVQIKLGHKSVKTTEEIYLAHVEVFGEKQGVTHIRKLLGLAA